jgi:peptidoglycan-N-acetylglucosamine deacetylase
MGLSYALAVTVYEVAISMIFACGGGIVLDLGHPGRWFRPFGSGGNLDDRLLKPSVVDYLIRNRHSCVLWNAIPRDWDDPVAGLIVRWSNAQSLPWTLMVVHDLPTGAMDHLEHILDRTDALGARFHQDFPPDCVPIRAGGIVLPIQNYVSSTEESVRP